VKGNPGSPGKVKGIARVIRTLAEADRLHPGEILVTESTTPPWTPLFAVAAGLVSDTGGVLSHTAVVAREYGLPAVVGTGRGTDRIVDGMVIEVDGDAGLVHLPEGA
jgi:pyruvate,water dikinase